MENHKEVGTVLRELQQAMISAEYWSNAGIDAEALNSLQPFCLDTMNFSQWLQFVFIPRIQALIDAVQVLPNLVKGQGMEPMASEFYKNTESDQAILVLIRKLDSLLQG